MPPSLNRIGIRMRSLVGVVPRVAAIGAGMLLFRTALEMRALRQDLARAIASDSFAVDGTYGTARLGAPIVLGIVGDSLASGAGASAPEKTLAVLIALEIAHREQRAVRLVNVARSGSGTRHLSQQLHQLSLRLGSETCDIVYIRIGAIDVSYRVAWHVTQANIRMCVHDLTRRGAKVVFGMPERVSLPADLAGKPLVGLACDAMMAYRTRQQRGFIDGLRVHGYGAYMADASPLKPAFRDNPHYTSSDGLHPSDAGQAAVADVLVPQLITALHAHGPTHPEAAGSGPGGHTPSQHTPY